MKSKKIPSIAMLIMVIVFWQANEKYKGSGNTPIPKPLVLSHGKPEEERKRALEAAVEQCERRVAENPGDLEGNLELAKWYLVLPNKREEAREQLEKAREGTKEREFVEVWLQHLGSKKAEDKGKRVGGIRSEIEREGEKGVVAKQTTETIEAMVLERDIAATSVEELLRTKGKILREVASEVSWREERKTRTEQNEAKETVENQEGMQIQLPEKPEVGKEEKR